MIRIYIYCAGNNQLELRDMLNREFSKLCIWFAVNNLSLNLLKNDYMLFRNRPPDVDSNLHLCVLSKIWHLLHGICG